ncbi:MAG: ATP-binding protein [Betaproteobacteria bacterium AqS2]|uniref:ATP-binding protein n=1 Tax=Candidatus Amphirhobacter heronislandensis TaxID=1732024 RepID=A0A930UHS9_9GAMM|nr:ATP-binding protein [Betaproteobacteria bacterium AqS2]
MTHINRRQKEEVKRRLKKASAVVLLGQRQVGKTTLAKEIAREQDADYLNLREPETAAMLDEKGLRQHVAESGKHLTILDEIQTRRDLFSALITLIDDKRESKEGRGCFLLLGSSSLSLANKSNETLKGRVSYVNLDPIDVTEIDMPDDLEKLWLRGGLPAVFTADSDRDGFDHHRDLVRTLSMNDLSAEGARGVTPGQVINMLRILASCQGGVINSKEIGEKLDVDRRDVSFCISLLQELLIVRKLDAYGRSRVKNIAKSPKIYLCDSGTLHYLLRAEKISSLTPLMAGMSWEGFVIENILRHIDLEIDKYFYRTKKGVEIDLILRDPMRETWAIEIKKGTPDVSDGFYKAVQDIQPKRSFLVHGRPDLPRRENQHGIEIISLLDMCREAEKHFGPSAVAQPLNQV